MKILIQFYLFLCVMLFAIPLAAQDSNAAESFFELAKSYEKVKSFKLAAENYMLAGKAYEKRAKEYTTDGAIQKNLQLAVEAYNKAQTMYHQTKDSPNEMLAMKEAMRTNEPLFIKKLEAYKDSITKNPPKDPLVDIKQIPWVPGKKIVMVARASNFEIIVPQALKFTGPRVTTSDNTPMLRKNELSISVVETNKPSPFFVFSLMEASQDKNANSNKTQEDCEESAKKYKEPGAAVFFNNTEVKTIDIGKGIKACVTTHSSQQLDTKIYMFGWQILFAYKNNSYLITGSAPYAWKTCIQEMLKTFRLTEDGVVIKPCSPSEEYLLENLALEKVYKLPDEYREISIVLEPFLARDKVSDGWHLITKAVIDALTIYQKSNKYFNLFVNGKKAFYGAAGVFADWVKIEIIIQPLLALGMPSVSPTNVIKGYMEVFDKTISAVSGLENKISNMTVNLSWAVPYLNINTKCIPRFTCINGRMEPDRKTLAYRYQSKGSQTDRQAYQNLTPNQAVEKKEKILNRFLEEIMKDAADYANAEDCASFTNKLNSLNFPVAPDECARRQTEVTRLQLEQSALTTQKISFNQSLKTHNATRQVRIDEKNISIQQHEKSIDQKRTIRNQKEQLKKNYENSDAPEKAALVKALEEQLLALNIQLGNLISESIRLEWDRDDLVVNKFESQIKVELQLIDSREIKLKKELMEAQKALNNCQ